MEHEFDAKVRLVSVDYGDEKVPRSEKSKRIREKIGPLTDIRYSISHTDKYSVAAISRDPEVGVDIEHKNKLTGRKDAMDILFPKDCKIRDEVRWCLHEAIGKMEGDGLHTYYPIVSTEECEDETLLAGYKKGDTICEAKVKVRESDKYMLVWGYKNKQERRKT